MKVMAGGAGVRMMVRGGAGMTVIAACKAMVRDASDRGEEAGVKGIALGRCQGLRCIGGRTAGARRGWRQGYRRVCEDCGRGGEEMETLPDREATPSESLERKATQLPRHPRRLR